MAFKFLKKKEQDFPSGEKEEILGAPKSEFGEFPPLPEGDAEVGGDESSFPERDLTPSRPALPNFSEGFRSPEEMKPQLPPPMPMPQRAPPMMFERREEIPTSLPPFEKPEPLPMPRTIPREIEAPESEFGSLPKLGPVPHIYIKISKYREVMKNIEDLNRFLEDTKIKLDELNSTSEEERLRIREAAEILLKVEKHINYLESTFILPNQ